MKIRERVNPGGSVSYQVDLGKVGKKRNRQSFSSKEEARAALVAAKSKLRKEGESGLDLSAADRVRFAQAAKRLAAAGASIEEAVEFFLGHARPVAGALSIRTLVDRCLLDKELSGKRPRYLTQLKSSSLSFCVLHGDRPAHEITTPEVEAWLQGGKWVAKTRNGYLTDLRTVFAWGAKRGHLTVNPCAAVTRAEEEDKPPGIFDVATCQRLLTAALETDAKLGLLGYIALGMFAGIRPEEIARLGWGNVCVEEAFIEVPAAVSKTRRRRIVKMSPNLAAWLTLAARAEHGGITPIAWLVKRMGSLRRTAKIANWPNDVLRHCFASYHLAAHGSADKTATELGHYNTQMLFEHYRELVRPKEAAAFWELMP